jgi:hypothetical protein
MVAPAVLRTTPEMLPLPWASALNEFTSSSTQPNAADSSKRRTLEKASQEG